MAKKKTPIVTDHTQGESTSSPLVALRLPASIKAFLEAESVKTGNPLPHLIIRAIEKAYHLPETEIRPRGWKSGVSRKKSDGA